MAKFGCEFTELCLKIEFCIMAELICILLRCCCRPNQFPFAFTVFLDPENIGFGALMARFGHELTELYWKDEFCIMADLIYIIMQNAQGCQNGIIRILKKDPSKISKLQKMLYGR